MDPARRHIYLTEDAGDGGLYRFVPAQWPNLSSGTLQVLTQSGSTLGWATVPDPDGSPTACKDQVSSMRVFNGGEAPGTTAARSNNVTVARSRDVYVAEDGGNMELVILSREGEVAPFLRLSVSGSEITGPAFSPSGTRLYFSSQRNPGRTYEITGPFRS